MTIYRVTFHLDGRGVIYDPSEPIHLDGLIEWAGAFRYPPGEAPRRGDSINDRDLMPLPVAQEERNGHRIYRASALWPADENGALIYDQRHFRKRFRMERSEQCIPAAINQSTGPMRLVNQPVHPALLTTMVAWFQGKRVDVRKWFRRLRAIGAKREMGYGGVLSIDIDETDEDRCVEWEGRAMRYIPHPRGLRLVRARPPYWNATNKVACLAPGEQVPQ